MSACPDEVEVDVRLACLVARQSGIKIISYYYLTAGLTASLDFGISAINPCQADIPLFEYSSSPIGCGRDYPEKRSHVVHCRISIGD